MTDRSRWTPAPSPGPAAPPISSLVEEAGGHQTGTCAGGRAQPGDALRAAAGPFAGLQWATNRSHQRPRLHSSPCPTLTRR